MSSRNVAVLAASLICASVVGFTAPALAQLATPSPEASRAAKELLAKEPDLFTKTEKAPDVSNVPFFMALLKQGGKYFPMGERSGLQGWLLIVDGRMQMVYSTPDNRSVIIGSLFTAEGKSVTGVQMIQLIENNKEVYGLLDASLKKMQGASSAEGASPEAAPAQDFSLPIKETVTAATLSPGEQLLQDLQGASGVVLGKGNGPELTMIMETTCPNCKAAWKTLRDPVMAGKIRLRLVPVSNMTPESEGSSAMLLEITDPLAAWDKYVLGNKEALAGTPSANHVQALQANRAVLDKWKIQATPYIVYRGKDGKIKIIVGKPDQLSAILADLF